MRSRVAGQFVALALTFAACAACRARAADMPPINSPATTDEIEGKFVWADLFTSDPSAASSFYTGLLGWTAATIERTGSDGSAHPYVVLSNEGRPIAGIAHRPINPKDAEHGRWVGFVSVPDVAQTVAAATAGGARVLFAVKTLPQRGTQAILFDPEGALIGLLHSSSGDPPDYAPDPGDWAWAELFSRDPQKAAAYYRSIVGYDVMPDSRTPESKSFVLVSGGYSRASVAPVPDRPKAHPAWLLFVRVANVEQAAARVPSLGGRVLIGPKDTSGEYWKAIVADPTGGVIGLVQLEEPSSKPPAQSEGAQP